MEHNINTWLDQARDLSPKCTAVCTILLAVYFGSRTGADVVIAGASRVKASSWLNTKCQTSSTLFSSGIYVAGTNNCKKREESQRSLKPVCGELHHLFIISSFQTKPLSASVTPFPPTHIPFHQCSFIWLIIIFLLNSLNWRI